MNRREGSFLLLAGQLGCSRSLATPFWGQEKGGLEKAVCRRARETGMRGGPGDGEWILCPERDIWRPLRPGKNNINIGKERRESFAGLLGPALGRGYQV